MKIWIVNPFDPIPGESFKPGRYATLAEMLLERGHRVTWFTSSFFHATKSMRPADVRARAQKKDLKVIFVEAPPYSGNISPWRILNHLIYARNFSSAARSQEEKPDLILASAPPLASAKASIRIAEQLGLRCVVDVQDLWPEVYKSIFPHKLLPLYRFIFHPFKVYANDSYNRAHGLVAVSQQFLNRAASICSDIEKPGAVIHLGVDLNLFREVEENYRKFGAPTPKKGEGDFWVVYVGTIGKSYDIKTSLSAALLLRDSPRIKFFFAGSGPQLEEMKNLASHLKLENVYFLGHLSFGDMVSLLKTSDVGLNAIESKAPHSSNKLFDYMAAGLPIINSLKGEVEELLRERGIGLQYEAGDEGSLADVIQTLSQDKEMCARMGARARETVEQEFDRRKSYLKYIDFLQNVASTRTN